MVALNRDLVVGPMTIPNPPAPPEDLIDLDFPSELLIEVPVTSGADSGSWAVDTDDDEEDD
jgi:hypothetical protein